MYHQGNGQMGFGGFLLVICFRNLGAEFRDAGCEGKGCGCRFWTQVLLSASQGGSRLRGGFEGIPGGAP